MTTQIDTGYIIKEFDGRFYIFHVDKYGNMQDTMRHYKTFEQAYEFMNTQIEEFGS